MLSPKIGVGLLLGMTLLACDDSTGPEGPQPVTIDFAVNVGSRAFACGQTYSGLGVTQSTAGPQDMRFYVHDVRLVSDAGLEIPVVLDNVAPWQNGRVALLDFENASGSCANGTAETRTIVTGIADAGTYTGLRFKLGVPFDQNHVNQATAATPLNLSSMFWSWNAGYIFWKLDLSTTGRPNGFSVHLGSTGCTPSGSTTVPTSCANTNRPEIQLSGFELGRDVVTADVSTLLAATNLDSSAGCHSFAGSAACETLLPRFGLAYGSASAAPQAVFNARPR